MGLGWVRNPRFPSTVQQSMYSHENLLILRLRGSWHEEKFESSVSKRMVFTSLDPDVVNEGGTNNSFTQILSTISH